DVRGADLVARGVAGQARLDIADALEAEPADQAAGETRQAFQLRYRVGGTQGLDLGERIRDLAGVDNTAVLARFHGVATEADGAARGRADDRGAAETFAALDRFEEIGVRGGGQLQVDRKRGVEVGQDLADDGDAGVAGFSGVALELFGRDQGRLPSGNTGHGKRRRGAAIAKPGARRSGGA